MTESGEEPAWFREHFGQGEFIEQQYGLPAKVPLIFALALELSFEMPGSEKLKRLRRRIRDELSRLKKARAGLQALRHPLIPLGPEYIGHREVDGTIEFETGPDPIDAAIEAIDTIMEKLSAVEIGRKKKSSVPIAVRKIEGFVEQYNPALTPAQREDLRHYLFDIVRQRHGHRSRAPDPDCDEMPRYRDHSSIARAQRRKRKTDQKTG